MSLTRKADTLFRQSVAQYSAGNLEGAGAGFQQVLALDPRHAPSLHRLGTIAYRLGQIDAAANLIEAAIQIDGQTAAYHNDLGEVYRALDLKGDAVQAFLRAYDLDPTAATMNNLAMLLQEAGKLPDAIELYRKATQLQPDLALAHMNLGCALLETGDVAEAAISLETAHRLNPQDPTILLNLGNVRIAEGRPAYAVAVYRSALTLQPDCAVAALNLGRAHRDLGQADIALQLYDRAAALQPSLHVARWNAALCALSLGDFKRGWHDFPARWNAGAVPPHHIDLTEWDGSPLDGKVLLVHCEQGLGDTLQFVRFMPLLKSSGAARIILLCQPPLKRLLQAVWPDLITSADPMPDCDYRIPLLDLPRLFDIGEGALSTGAAYLHAPASLHSDWETRLSGIAKPRVGIVWQGRREHPNDRQRSAPFYLLEPLFGLPEISWFSLQKEGNVVLPPTVSDLSAELTDMADTAAAIEALDLVIAVDTSVAHLAGALGKPVWVLLPFAADWRWMSDRDDSPWYPSARLFRQADSGDWTGLIDTMATAISSWAASRSGN